jgi:hypothetical protein
MAWAAARQEPRCREYELATACLLSLIAHRVSRRVQAEAVPSATSGPAGERSLLLHECHVGQFDLLRSGRGADLWPHATAISGPSRAPARLGEGRSAMPGGGSKEAQAVEADDDGGAFVSQYAER